MSQAIPRWRKSTRGSILFLLLLFFFSFSPGTIHEQAWSNNANIHRPDKPRLCLLGRHIFSRDKLSDKIPFLTPVYFSFISQKN